MLPFKAVSWEPYKQIPYKEDLSSLEKTFNILPLQHPKEIELTKKLFMEIAKRKRADSAIVSKLLHE